MPLLRNKTLEGLTLYYHVPKTKKDWGRYFPTEEIVKRMKRGYIINRLYLYPKDNEEFIRIINRAKRS